MARSEVPLEEMYANLVIDDEEEGGIIVNNNEIVAQKQIYVLVGKFLTEKNINYSAMQNVMAGLWRPKEGMEVHDMGGLKYSFVFFHKLDVQKVIDGGPWSFEQAMLVYHQVKEGEDPLTLKLQELEIWVQIYDIPRGFLSEGILKSVGSSIGRYVQSDPATFEGGWKTYVRIRVAINVEKPLKRRVKIKREGNSWSWLNFKYERLGTFCFVCGIIGHSERDCNVVYANLEKMVEKAYGVWLRAPSRNAKNNTGARWLRSTSVGTGMWGHKHEGDGSTTGHGVDREVARFMEVDGVVRQKTDDTEEIRVESRENRELVIRDRNMAIMGRETRDVNTTAEEMETANVVVESKRKRIDTGLLGENHGTDTAENVNNTQTTGPKNVIVAGSGVQTRQGL